MAAKTVRIILFVVLFLGVTTLTVHLGQKVRRWWNPPESVSMIPVPRTAEARKALEVYREGAYVEEDQPAAARTDLISGIGIIDVHEHVQTREDALRLLVAMDQNDVAQACLLGTSIYTFTLDKRYGFERIAENNRRILALKEEFPDRFCAFVTIDPADPAALPSLQEWVKQGADGLKLYLGHGAGTGKGPFHVMALDDPAMLPVYAWAESVGLPIIYHVNLIKYYDEFERVLERFPDLRVNLPHFGLHSNSWQRLSRLGALLDRFPNLYIDVSYGWWVFHIQGFENLAANRTMLRAFITRYADRFLFGADMVVESTKPEAVLTEKLRSYRQILESPVFDFYLKPARAMWGLTLDRSTMEKIYRDNPLRFLGEIEK